MLAAVNNAVAAAKIVPFEFIAKCSVFQSTQKPPKAPSTFKSYNLQRFECAAGFWRVHIGEWNR